MTITFDNADEQVITRKLIDAGVYRTNQQGVKVVEGKRVKEVLYNINAAFLQQLETEADYMIEEFEVAK